MRQGTGNADPVPETYSFWDLHVALQDAMGWLDYHLHVFRVARLGTGEVEQIGIPDDDPFEGEKPTLPGWRSEASLLRRRRQSLPSRELWWRVWLRVWR